MVTRVMVHPDFGRQGEVAGGFGAERVLPGLPGRPRRLRRWAGCSAVACWSRPTRACCGKTDTYPARRAGIAATRSSGLRGRRLGCFVHPGRSGGNDHGWFRSQFGVQAFEKPSGRPDLNRRPLDPQDMGLTVLTGQWGSGGPALGAPTCWLSGQVHSVWSQSGPKRSPGALGRTPRIKSLSGARSPGSCAFGPAAQIAARRR
jgi:hypothetical protein